jgi:transcriptional regulator with XRE-family HTH domain
VLLIVAGEIRKALGGRIRIARKTRLNNMPLEEFGRQVAQLMGRPRAFSNVTVSNWETGRQEPSWEALVSIARLTHLPLRYFAGIGSVEDYPLAHWLEPKPQELNARLRTLIGAVQRLEAPQQRLVVRQVESLIDSLQQEDLAAAGGAKSERS